MPQHNMVRTRERRHCRCPRARHVHGTRAAYMIDRCRCFDCRVAHANSERAYRNGGTWTEDRLIDATGTRRRLQALAAIGITCAAIADHLGVTPVNVSKFRATRGRVSVDTANRIATVYEQLWDKPCDNTAGRKAKTHARKMSWAPPMAWDDDRIDDPTARPEQLDGAPRYGLKPCGTHAAYARHHARGEHIDTRCAQAERAYQAAKQTTYRARRAEQEQAA